MVRARKCIRSKNQRLYTLMYARGVPARPGCAPAAPRQRAAAPRARERLIYARVFVEVALLRGGMVDTTALFDLLWSGLPSEDVSRWFAAPLQFVAAPPWAQRRPFRRARRAAGLCDCAAAVAGAVAGRGTAGGAAAGRVGRAGRAQRGAAAGRLEPRAGGAVLAGRLWRARRARARGARGAAAAARRRAGRGRARGVRVCRL